MIKINNKSLEKFALEHYKSLKHKIDIKNDELKEILLAKPEKLLEVAKKYEEYNDNFKNKYDNFAKKKIEYNAYDLADKLQVNVCPYCNENTTYTIIMKDGKEVLRPEFDHFYDKASYPVLSLSFYNLIPCCHTCNSNLKGSEEFSLKSHIHPYHNSFGKYTKFRLQINKTNFYHDSKGFEIKLEYLDTKSQNSAKVFHIEERYQKHKDIALELIQKQAMYNDSYIDELLKEYEGTLFKNREDLQRLISGGYISDDEIGKRPLSKLIKDITKELGVC